MGTHTTDELLRQFHHNQSCWVARLATGQIQPQSPHRHLLHIGDTLVVRPGASGVIMLPVDGDEQSILAEHDHALSWLQRHQARDILVWNMTPNPTIDLALLAQGYAAGFEPWWMTRDLTTPIALAAHTVRRVTALDIQLLLESDIPYVIRDQVPANRALTSALDGSQVMWLAAIKDGEPVGHAIVNMSGDHAGLFNVGVSGKHRHQGIGSSLTLAAMQIARDHGALTMNLNSTPVGKRLYERLGFRQFGVGQTWVRSGPQVHIEPDAHERALVTAIGTGDITNIRMDPNRHKTLQCRMSPQELAARFGQQESLLEIIRQGATPDIVSLWRAGLRDEAIAAAGDPVARELISGATRAHPIHLSLIHI